MNKEKGNLIMAFFFLTFFTGLTLIALTYSIKASRLPLLVSVPGVLLSAAQVFREARILKAARKTETAENGHETSDRPRASGKGKKLLLMLGWMVLLVLMIWVFGFLATIPVYTLLFMRSRQESWFLSIIFAVSGFAILYFLFVVGLNMELYPGLVYDWFSMYE
ncbi:MAG: tripartite tricarboxylate transporter TctB family protein [Deltaproteobacteria bacterium]|nr:tripartite tricarboxylate transporter TctB family protein [Deltaproteobacteria bacterium]